MGQCQAKSKRTGKRCQRPATKHDGRYCYHHGGAKGSGGDGRPIKHALYSKHVPTNWQAEYEYFKSDPQILSLQSDIAVARVARARFLKNCEGSPLTAELADTILEHGIKIGKLIEIHSKVACGERYTITVQGFDALLAQVSDVINKAIDEHGGSEELRAAIADGLARVGNKQ